MGVWDVSGGRGGVTGEKLYCVLVQKVFAFFFYYEFIICFKGFIKEIKEPFLQKLILHIQIV